MGCSYKMDNLLENATPFSLYARCWHLMMFTSASGEDLEGGGGGSKVSGSAPQI